MVRTLLQPALASLSVLSLLSVTSFACMAPELARLSARALRASITLSPLHSHPQQSGQGARGEPPVNLKALEAAGFVRAPHAWVPSARECGSPTRVCYDTRCTAANAMTALVPAHPGAALAVHYSLA